MGRAKPSLKKRLKASREGTGKHLPRGRSASGKANRQSDDEADGLNIAYDEFHPEWNYTISPRPKK